MGKSRPKMTKDIVPEHFTLTLAMVDAIPVLCFCGTMVLVGMLLHSSLFTAGAALVLFAGACKVLWKVIVVLRRKNIWWMFLQMRILMPLGMLLMLAAFLLQLPHINGAAILAAVTGMPAVICFGIGIAGMLLMTIFGFTLDAGDVRSNWIEQITNGVAQVAFLIGVLLLL